MASRACGVFIAGTDTGVGKTRVAADVVRALARDGLEIAVMKPIAAGADPTPGGLRNADAVELMAAANVESPYEMVNPYCLPLPASPHIAAQEAGISIELGVIRQNYDSLAAAGPQLIAIEGAGGWLAPISDTESMADVAITLGAPVVLVVGLRLGCLNHALLTAAAIQASGLTFAGWVANSVQPHFEHAAQNIALLERRLQAPLLEKVAFDASAFATVASLGRLKDALCLW